MQASHQRQDQSSRMKVELSLSSFKTGTSPSGSPCDPNISPVFLCDCYRSNTTLDFIAIRYSSETIT